ncbi:uncharacterized protein LOC121420596 [Lytechinus variegatus]|uniref:uncharacterized protein LOC121420596 n=1 Tax=Lytechinus variegatus TaxID=7654 RepID=UPI001BB17B56|nr:uncharacterized protein LOC121420596 [Lytechinus variegatus]
MIPHMTLHIQRKHSNLTLQERHEYREIMLRETPVLRSKGSKRRRKLLKCPLCPSNVQRLDDHIMNIHGKKRGSKIMKALIAKAREFEGERAATGESTSSLQKHRQKNITQVSQAQVVLVEQTSNELGVEELGDIRTGANGCREDGTETKRTEEDGKERARTEEDGTKADRTIVGTEDKTKQYSDREDQADITLKDQTGGEGLDKDLSQEDRIEEAEGYESANTQVQDYYSFLFSP